MAETDVLTAGDFGRCHCCQRALPMRLLDPAIREDDLVIYVSDELYGRCHHPGKPGTEDGWRPLHGKRVTTGPEAAFIRAKGASIKEVY